MLVLVSFGLVLLATILLVVGLLSDDGLNLIYLSIAASVTAAIVLFVAFRKAKPKGETSSTAPAPLDDDVAPAPLPEETPAPATAAVPAATAPRSRPARVVAEPEPEPEPEPVAEDDEWSAADDDWADEPVVAADEDDDIEFPIADYDDLKVGEIMPLLPQLYSDELDVVIERERAGKDRATIIARLEELKITGTEADAAEAEAEAPVTAAPATTSIDLADDDADDGWADEPLFPIADYDELSVSQILPLLPQLEPDELEEVKEREVAGAARKSLVTEIDRYLGGEVDEDDDVDEAPAAAAAALPIAGYADLTVAQIRPQLSDLSGAELRAVLDYEQARDNRATIINEIERRLESDARPARTTTTKRRTATKATKKRATKKKAAAKKAATRTRFPIANYDDLTVAEIRPRLTDLSDRQLEQVRERELTGAGRKTILKDIDSKLS